MQITATPNFINAIPLPIRMRLQFVPGMVLEFDEECPYLKVMPAACPPMEADLESFDSWLLESVGMANGKLTTASRMAETRGEH